LTPQYLNPAIVPTIDIHRANAMIAATSSAGYLLGALARGPFSASGLHRPCSSPSMRERSSARRHS
jgi:hypothetical protein